MRVVSVVCGVLLLASPGCRQRSVEAAYTPTASMSLTEATAVITRCLEEQPGSYAAMDVKVSTERLTFVKSGGRLLRGGGPHATAFYFDSLGRMDITPKRKGNVVRVWDSSGVMRIVAVIPDPERAKRFMDAMVSISRMKP